MVYLIFSSGPEHFHQPEFQALDAVAGWNVTLLIRNPNAKQNITYVGLNAELWHGSYGNHVASTCTYPLLLFQDVKEETRVRVEFASVGSAGDVANRTGEFGVTVLVIFVYETGRFGVDVGMRIVTN
ncbi:protein YLS9-like [Senna tora]|uniref:Protein YLS9-like n=1 Tax=Senna tora TaxID=362788 RepID=A0A834WXB5_9FABA|nr:protein YLS9-like [Senna tora]